MWPRATAVLSCAWLRPSTWMTTRPLRRGTVARAMTLPVSLGRTLLVLLLSVVSAAARRGRALRLRRRGRRRAREVVVVPRENQARGRRVPGFVGKQWE